MVVVGAVFQQYYLVGAGVAMVCRWRGSMPLNEDAANVNWQRCRRKQLNQLF